LLADDQALLRHGLQMMIDAQPDMACCGSVVRPTGA
jgi:DNA-binding NarL/FixJ family response regulator